MVFSKKISVQVKYALAKIMTVAVTKVSEILVKMRI